MIKASCLSFSVNNSKPEQLIDGFSFDYTTKTKVDIDNTLLFIQLKIDISAAIAGDEAKHKAASFDFGFTYEVDNLEQLIQDVEGHRELDRTLHMSVLGIAFSTARGIILTKAANTIIQDAYLPIVNPSHLLDPNFQI
ncbi:MAG: hypothetical protein WKF87_16345 [Chryseolinea sp.]